MFPSQYKKLCRIVTKPKKNIFSYSFASGHVKCSSESHAFFRWLSKLFVLKTIIYYEIDGLCEKQDASPEVDHIDAEIAVLTTLSKNFGRNPKSFVQIEKTISRIKSFEVKTTLPNCSSVNVDLFLTTLQDFSRSKSKQNNENESFPEKITSLKLFVWKGTRHFRQSFCEDFGRNMTKYFAQFPKEKVSEVFWKKYF